MNVIIQNGFLCLDGGRGNHKKRYGSKTVNDSSTQPTKLDDVNVISFAVLGNDITKDNVYGDPVKGTNVVSFDESFHILDTPRNSSGGSPEVVKDGMYSGLLDPKVVEGVDESVSTILKSFASLVKMRLLRIRFGFSLYGHFVGKRVTFMVVENYIKNAWKKFGLVPVMADGELKADMVIAIPNVEDDG
ncbi:hypothetical protein Tco_0236054 [Tanacetum coccineum]